ncbi:MAG: hypothetical protein A2Y73_08605 [Chloroflexi bacterium RBG_13_56_8]|nr:MAG: hypothetical protein A2Y73_08605 [Chloroflexi bacterium RBG_13_56_8]
MNDRNYWLDLFTGVTWQEFLDAGAKVSGFRESRRRTVQQIKPGDYLLCYLTGVSRFIGVLEVTSGAFEDRTSIWKDEDFPWRVRVKIVVSLEPETAVPIQQLRDELSIFQNLSSPHAWTSHVRGSPARWKASDGEVVLRALVEAQSNPIFRPIDVRKLARRPRALKSKGGSVTIPESEEPTDSVASVEPSLHQEMQWLLLKLGNDMGLDVWVARNDRGRQVRGNLFTQLPRMRSELPRQFDDATNRTIELIDVLWLAGNTIVAAFEIECTTSIYSGLLRMSDLVSMQPNINIPLYLVAPDERRDKVISELNRPTFSRLSPPLSEMCKYIPIPELRERVSRVTSFVRYLKPEFLDEISESCEVEEV